MTQWGLVRGDFFFLVLNMFLLWKKAVEREKVEITKRHKLSNGHAENSVFEGMSTSATS